MMITQDEKAAIAKEFSAAQINGQPTISQINEAITDYSIVFGIPGASGDALQKLFALRKSKTTWMPDEQKFRFRVDAMLDQEFPQWRNYL